MKQASKILYVIFGLWHGLLFAAIQIQLEPKQPTTADTIRLSLTIDHVTHANDKPKITALPNDLTIVGTEQSMAYSVVNGTAQASTQWVILLTARRAGQWTIPPIQIGQERTPAVTVVVHAQPGTHADADQQSPASKADLLITGDISKSNPYIDEQIVYTVRIYHKYPLVDNNYKPPEVAHALLFPLGNGSSYQSIYQGEVYAVEEQQYAIFPQKSGQLRLTPPAVDGILYGFRPERIHATAKPIALQVQPVPQTYQQSHWLPAKAVRLTESYATNHSVIVQGNTLVRTLTLQATGVPAELLPALAFTSTDGYKVYPDKPDLENKIKHHELIGHASMQVTYLFDKPGTVTIPALVVPWFNIVTGRAEQIVLPERVLTITKTATAQAVAPQAKPAQPVTAADASSQPAHAPVAQPAEAVSKPCAPAAIADHSLWVWLTIAILSLGWLGTIFLWWLSPRMLSWNANGRAAFKRLESACLQHQPAQARAALLQWAAMQWPDVNILNMTDLARVVHDMALKKQLACLSQALYSADDKAAWRGDALWHALSKYRKRQPRKSEKGNSLPPINPY